jgi:hypothetical protein
MLRVVLSCCLLAVLTAAPDGARAQEAPTVEVALQQYFGAESSDEAVEALRGAGFDYERLLVAESLPSRTTVMVEVELASDSGRLRYPLKLARRDAAEGSSWQVDWAPEPVYARALAALSVDGLAGFEAPGFWADVERLPAFPVVVLADRFVTPFGAVAAEPAEDAEQPAELAAPEDLFKHAQRWTGMILEDAPGPAGIDLIVGADVSWRRATQAMMAPAAVGLFRLYLVGRAGGDLVALASNAPVMGDDATSQSAPLVVGMYPAGDQSAFRIRIGERLLDAEDSCAERMSLCAQSAEAFELAAVGHVTDALAEEPTKIAYVLFAATADFSVAQVAAHYRALSVSLGVESQKMFLGFIADEEK